jgi:hypothetical protein
MYEMPFQTPGRLQRCMSSTSPISLLTSLQSWEVCCTGEIVSFYYWSIELWTSHIQEPSIIAPASAMLLYFM